MKHCSWFVRSTLGILSLVLFSPPESAHAVLPPSSVTLSFVHAYNGREAGESRSFPVDVAINNSCVAKGINFRQSATLEAVQVGSHTVTVYRSDGRCGGPAIGSKQLVFTESDQYEVFSYSFVLNPGKAGKASLALFENKASSPALLVRNLSATSATGDLRFTASDGFVVQEQLTLSPRSSRFFSTDTPNTTTFSLKASIPQQKMVVSRGGFESLKLTVVYVVGSARFGFQAIQERVQWSTPLKPSTVLNFVHGFERAPSQGDRSFPVDVAINGRCVAKGIHFRSASAISQVREGEYQLTVHSANGKCSNPIVARSRLTLLASDISDFTSRSFLLSPKRDGMPALSLHHNRSSGRELLVHNRLSGARSVLLQATRPDGSTYSRSATINSRKAIALPLEDLQSQRYLLSATDSKGRTIRYRGQANDWKTGVVYLVGAQPQGLNVVREGFDPDRVFLASQTPNEEGR